MEQKKITYKEVWEKLRAIDTSPIQYKKGHLDYIGWADCWSTLMQYYPQAIYSFFEPKFYGESDKVTCEVTCIISIGELTRTSTLPIMTSSMPMKSVINPSSRDINDARQRAMVKAIAMFGLGLHLWEKKDDSPRVVNVTEF